MKKELCYLFLGLALVTSTVVAQEPSKPYRITNGLDCPVSIQTSKGNRLPDIGNGGFHNLDKEDFPISVFSGCGDQATTPEPSGQNWPANCYMIGIGAKQQLISIIDRCPNAIKPLP